MAIYSGFSHLKWWFSIAKLPNIPGLVNIHFAMENHHAINGKIHYFDWAIFNCYVSSPEGNATPHFCESKSYSCGSVSMFGPPDFSWSTRSRKMILGENRAERSDRWSGPKESRPPGHVHLFAGMVFFPFLGAKWLAKSRIRSRIHRSSGWTTCSYRWKILPHILEQMRRASHYEYKSKLGNNQ